MATEELAARLVTEGLRKFESDMAKADQAVGKSADSIDEAGESGLGFAEVLKGVALGIGIATAAAVAMGVAFKKAVEFGRIGAQAKQTEQTFAGLREEIGLDIEYLQLLRDASRGTISDLELMAGISTLTAGASREFGSQLAMAYPQLIEYAKAAAKLNPHLGDTTFMLESISTGLKRGSPMILDNLGLVIKVGDANAAYAEQLGKSVDQLTAEEKQMALLNDTMRAGDRLIEQVGGSTEALTDQYEQLEAATLNAKTEAAKMFEQLVDLSGAITLVESTTRTLQFENLAQEMTGLGLATADNVREMRAYIFEGLRGMKSDEARILMAERYEEKINEMSAALDTERQKLTEVTEAADGAVLAHERHTESLEDHVEIVRSAAEEQWLLNKQTEDDRLRTQDWTEALKNHEAAMDEDKAAVQEAINAYYAMEAATRAAEVATGDYFAEVIEAEDETWNMADAMWESAKAADWDAVQMAVLGGALGLYTEEQVEAALRAAILAIKLDEMAAAVADGTMTVEDAISAFYDLRDSMDSVPNAKHITVTWSMEQVDPGAAGLGIAGRERPSGGPDGRGTAPEAEETVEEQVTRHMRRVSESISTSVRENVGEAVGTGVSRGISEGTSRGISEGIADAEPALIEGLLSLGRGLGGVGAGFATQLMRAELDPLAESIKAITEEIERLEQLREQGQFIPMMAMNALEEERTAMLREQARLQEVLLNLEKQRQDLAFLEQQVKLLDLIREYGLDAEAILGGMELGIDASTESLVQAMTAAMQQIIIGIEEELEIGSPSQRFAEIGSQMMSGLGQGIAAQVPNIQAQIQTAVLPASATTSSSDYYDQRQYHYGLTTQSLIQPGGLAMEFTALEMASR